MVRIAAHPIRLTERNRAICDARVRAHVSESLEPRCSIEHPVPDPRELRERHCQPRSQRFPVQAFACAGRVDPAREVVQTREDRLDHGVARGGVRPTSVDVGDEEVACRGRGGGEDAHLREDHLGSGLQVRFAVGCGAYIQHQKVGCMRGGLTLGVLVVTVCAYMLSVGIQKGRHTSNSLDPEEYCVRRRLWVQLVRLAKEGLHYSRTHIVSWIRQSDVVSLSRTLSKEIDLLDGTWP